MQEYKVSGPDGPTVGMEAVRALLGGVSEDTVNRLIAQGRFPRPFRAGAKSPAQWQQVGRLRGRWRQVAETLGPARTFIYDSQRHPAKGPQHFAGDRQWTGSRWRQSTRAIAC
jgi:hypothetical protein